MTEIPKQALLAKLLGMTDSASDNEALSAIRQANRLLKSIGYSWDDLIREKIKVFENPFSQIADPRTGRSESPNPAYTPRPNYVPEPPPPPPKPDWLKPRRVFVDHLAGMADTFQNGEVKHNPQSASPPPIQPKKVRRPRGGNPNNYRPGIGEL